MELRPSRRFEKAYKTLSLPVGKRVRKSLKQFLTNPRHPSLHFEKLSSGYRTIRVDLNFRIVLREAEGGFELIDIATHTKAYADYG